MTASVYDAVVARLSSELASTRCADLIAMLESLHFTVKDVSRGNHKVFNSPALSEISDFKTSNFDCGHGRNHQVRPQYIRNILKVLRNYETEIRTVLGEKV